MASPRPSRSRLQVALLGGILLLMVVLAYWWSTRRVPPSAPTPRPAQSAAAQPPSLRAAAPYTPPAQRQTVPHTAGLPDLIDRQPTGANLDHRITRYANGTVDLHTSIQRSLDLEGSADLQVNFQIIQDLLASYRTLFRTNPIGSENAEFTTALLGKNPHQVILLSPGLTVISPSGELLDPWGTPYYFHPLSATRLDLRSAGPDRTLWTPDDILQM